MAKDPYRYFRVEARELLDGLGRGALALEKGPPTAELVARLLRLAHTLKGAARVVRQSALAEVAHRIEDALSPHRDDGLVPRAGIDAVLALVDSGASALALLDAPAEPPRDAPTPAQRPAEEPAAAAVRAEARELDAVLEGIATAQARLAALGRSTRAVTRLRELTALLSGQLASPQAQREGGGVLGKARGVVDELPGLVAAIDRELAVGLEAVDRELVQVREAAERLRLLPAEIVFTALERAARDVAHGVGKKLHFEARGGDVRLDAQVLGVVQGALVQAVRNAVAHGIEPAEARAVAGKEPEGRLTLEVTRRGTRVVFCCRDDGRGVDLEGVRRAAVQRGMAPMEAARLGADELMALLLRGGLSTAGEVTELSGRGVGLDVARAAMEQLRGELRVHSVRGEGTTVELEVPVSLASLEVLLLESAGQRVAVPLGSVRRTLRVASGGLAWTAQGAMLAHEGATVPFAPLEQLLGKGAVTAHDQRERAWSAVLLEGAGHTAALGVERMLGTRSVVVRPLPRLAMADALCSGTSLDAEGTPLLLLEPGPVVERVRRGGLSARPPAVLRRPVLVIDDSMTTRMLEQSILESAGYEVETAASAEEGLERARARKFSLILVDVEMPGMDGFTFLETVRDDPALREVPAMLVSSRASPEDKRRGELAGARAYLVKSEFEQSVLLERIRTLVG